MGGPHIPPTVLTIIGVHVRLSVLVGRQVGHVKIFPLLNCTSQACFHDILCSSLPDNAELILSNTSDFIYLCI